MKVSVIILNWNGKKFLRECLASLESQTFRDFETVVVDNGSTDGSSGFVRETFPWVRLVELTGNTGFAGGNSRGLDVARGDFIVALNNDTKAEPEFLAELVAVAEAEPRAGMVAAKMRNFFNPGVIDAAGLKIAVNGLGYNVGYGEKDDGRFDPVPVFGPCGGAALYRRSMLEETGFFDPDFFAYYEDFDLAWRGRLAGWKSVAAPKAIVYHVHSATGGEWSAFKVYYTHRNKWYVILKNWPGSLLLGRLPGILCYDAASLVLAVVKGRGAAAVKAQVDVLRNLSPPLEKRKTVRRTVRVPITAVKEFFSPHEGGVRTLIRKLGWKK